MAHIERELCEEVYLAADKALDHAIDGRMNDACGELVALFEAQGVEHLTGVLCRWCSWMTRPLANGKVQFTAVGGLLNEATGEFHTVDDAPPGMEPMVWSMRFVSAWLNNDADQAYALIGSVWDDSYKMMACTMTLLQMCAGTVAHHLSNP